MLATANCYRFFRPMATSLGLIEQGRRWQTPDGMGQKVEGTNPTAGKGFSLEINAKMHQL